MFFTITAWFLSLFQLLRADDMYHNILYNFLPSKYKPPAEWIKRLGVRAFVNIFHRNACNYTISVPNMTYFTDFVHYNYLLTHYLSKTTLENERENHNYYLWTLKWFVSSLLTLIWVVFVIHYWFWFCCLFIRYRHMYCCYRSNISMQHSTPLCLLLRQVLN